MIIIIIYGLFPPVSGCRRRWISVPKCIYKMKKKKWSVSQPSDAFEACGCQCNRHKSIDNILIKILEYNRIRFARNGIKCLIMTIWFHRMQQFVVAAAGGEKFSFLDFFAKNIRMNHRNATIPINQSLFVGSITNATN